MTRIAHLTDLHLLERAPGDRDARDRLRLSFLTLGRPIDAELHRVRFAAALRKARAARAEHLVISGDLTEDGAPAQFEVLAEVLAESRWSPDEVTLVPGNHDAYQLADAWSRALEGPLAPYRRTSAPGTVVEIEGATIVAVATTIDQHWIRAAGRVGEDQRATLGDVLALEERRGRAAVVAMHHPPMPWGLRLGFIEGLLDVDKVTPILRARRNAHVLCGHIHRSGDHRLRPEDDARIFVADAVVDHPSPLRLYEACAGRLRPIDDALQAALGSPAFT
ncbi:MAG: metallophosphoesterase [Deltaproteobacteria bacterium]|nr:metallophosphoesterase [Deltaproteobacteria bacterium]